MSEWELLCQIFKAANANDQAALATLITEQDFNDKPLAQDGALKAFQVTLSNVIHHRKAAQKLARFTPCEKWSNTASLRQNLIASFLAQVIC